MPTTAPSRNRRLICVDLFAGAGGLSLGFEQAGFDVAVSVEYDPIHAAAHEFNFPYTSVICRDIRRVTGEQVRLAAGTGKRRIDVIVGGPPCQGFSLIGHRVLDDPRNALVFHFLRLVRELRPKYFVMENVPGMVTGGHRDLFDSLVAKARALGYKVHHAVLNAANFGVPQNRSRVFIVGSASGYQIAYPPEPVTALRSIDGLVKGDSNLPLCPSVEDAIADLPDIDDFEELREQDELVYSLPPASHFASILRGETRDPRDYSYRRVRPEKTLTGCLRAEHTRESRKRFLATPQGETESISRFFRLPLKGLSNTLRSGTATDRGAFTSPRPIHPMYARCISVREAARIHSFPDWFWFHQTKWHGFRQIGNSVPPLLARSVASEIVKVLKCRPRRLSGLLAEPMRELVRFDMKSAAKHFGVDPSVIPQRTRRVR